MGKDKGQTPESDLKGTISFSVRLTEGQRELLDKAAQKKGWTVTTLLKNAAMEKAAFIVNTAAPNKIDFHRTARQIADRVFTPRTALVPNPWDYPSGGLVSASTFEQIEPEHFDPTEPVVQVAPWQMPPEFVEQLRLAVRYGGTEFLTLLLEAAEAIAIRRRPEVLPDPIDPSTL